MHRIFVASVVIFTFCIGILGATGHAQAQGYPSKSIKMIVPTPPGSLVDLLARIISRQLQERMGATGYHPEYRRRRGEYRIGEDRQGERRRVYAWIRTRESLHTHPSLYKIKYNVPNDFTPISQVAGAFPGDVRQQQGACQNAEGDHCACQIQTGRHDLCVRRQGQYRPFGG